MTRKCRRKLRQTRKYLVKCLHRCGKKLCGLRSLALLLTGACLFSMIGGASQAVEEPFCAVARPAHTETTCYSWFFQPNRKHLCPPLDDSFRFIRLYNAWYADTDVPEGEKVIYLTFDAGYDNGNIDKVLDTLKKHKAPAAFFIVEHLVKATTPLVQRMIDEGHTVCNHTAKHHDMSRITDRAAFEGELRSMETVYRETMGCDIAPYYRPPEGKFTELNLQYATDMGYKTIFWSCAYADWDENRQPDPDYALEKLISLTHNGMVLLLHPTSSTNAKILDKLMDTWEKNGFRFGTLDELTSAETPVEPEG